MQRKENDQPVDPCTVSSCTIGPCPLGKCTCGAVVMFRLAAIVGLRAALYSQQIVWCENCNRRVAGYTRRLED